MAWSAVSSRVEAPRDLRVPFQQQADGGQEDEHIDRLLPSN